MSTLNKPPRDDDLRRFQQLLNDWAQAIVANEPEQIDEFIEPHWQLVDTAGIITRDRFLKVVRSGHLQHTSMTHEVLSVQRVGEVAIVITHGTNTGAWQGNAFTADEWVTEIFVRHGDTWRCTLTSLTPRRSPT